MGRARRSEILASTLSWFCCEPQATHEIPQINDSQGPKEEVQTRKKPVSVVARRVDGEIRDGRLQHLSFELRGQLNWGNNTFNKTRTWKGVCETCQTVSQTYTNHL